MKKIFIIVLAVILCFCLTACGGKLTEEQQLVADSVKTVLSSADYASWTALYKEFTGNDAKAAEITDVTHYQIDDFDGDKMDCYLVSISADVAHWVNEELEQGAVEERVNLLIHAENGNVINSITSDVMNFNGDTSTHEGRELYILWIYSNMQTGGYSGAILNDSETLTVFEDKALEAIEKAIG